MNKQLDCRIHIAKKCFLFIPKISSLQITILFDHEVSSKSVLSLRFILLLTYLPLHIASTKLNFGCKEIRGLEGARWNSSDFCIQALVYLLHLALEALDKRNCALFLFSRFEKRILIAYTTVFSFVISQVLGYIPPW